MRWGKKLWPAALAAAVSGCFAMTSFASGKDKITSVRLEVKDRMQPGSALGEDEELEIEAREDHYSVKEWEIENDGYTWEWKDTPRVKVTVVTENDYYFSVARDKVRIKGDQAVVYSVKKEEPQVLTVTLTLQPMYERVGAIGDAWLEGTVATWTPAIGAESYDIYLYRDSRAVGSRKNTADTTYNFGTAMRRDGEYYYRVRAVGGEGAKEGRFTESESLYISPDDVAAREAAKAAAKYGGEKKTLNNSQKTPEQWIQDEKGWRYNKADGSRAASEWVRIDGQRYYFDADGYMATGWISWEGHLYYLGTEGAMQSNCLTPDGYIVDEGGARVW